MIFRKQLKAGVLLYALLLTAVFSLLLQFYLLEVMANRREEVAMTQTAKAQIVAEITGQQLAGDSGELAYNLGTASYESSGDQVAITVTLKNGDKRTFTYAKAQPSFSSSSQQISTTSTSSVSASGVPGSSSVGSIKNATSETVETSGAEIAETSKLPQALIGRWQDAAGTIRISYTADGSIRLSQDGQEKSGQLTAYEEVSSGLYRVTSTMDDYVMPGTRPSSEGQEVALGFKISGNTLTFVIWTGAKGSAFDINTYQMTESEISYQRQ